MHRFKQRCPHRLPHFVIEHRHQPLLCHDTELRLDHYEGCCCSSKKGVPIRLAIHDFQDTLLQQLRAPQRNLCDHCGNVQDRARDIGVAKPVSVLHDGLVDDWVGKRSLKDRAAIIIQPITQLDALSSFHLDLVHILKLTSKHDTVPLFDNCSLWGPIWQTIASAHRNIAL